jgi:hypothetical protein
MCTCTPHDVAHVALEDGERAGRLNVPQGAGGVARCREDLPVVDEAAAREEARMARQFAQPACRAYAILGPQTVDGAQVVQAAARHKRARRRELVPARATPLSVPVVAANRDCMCGCARLSLAVYVCVCVGGGQGRTAQVMTQADLSGMAWALLVVYASHTMSRPSCEALFVRRAR